MKGKVPKGDPRCGKVALPLASGHPVQPSHVHPFAAPQRGHKDDAVEGVSHPLDGVGSADVEICTSALLREVIVYPVHESIRALG